MAYAVFEGDERLTRTFATEQEAWDAAEQAGLVDVDPDGKKSWTTSWKSASAPPNLRRTDA